MTARSSPLAVVTGATGPLGAAVLADLTGRGWQVAALARAGERLDAAGGQDGVHPVAVDLADRSAVQAAFEQVDRLGRPAALVALAGGYRPSTLAELTEDVLAGMWGANVAALLWSCQQAAARMTRDADGSGGGAIVTVGSKSAVTGRGPVAHATSKAAVVRVTELLAEELRPQGVRVNCVLPSVIDTPANREWMSADLAARAVPPEVIARVVAFLVGPDSAAVSGARIPVYGDA